MTQRLSGFLITVLGIAFLSQSWGLGWGTTAKLGAGFWPSVLSTALIVAGALVMLQRSDRSGHQSLKAWPTVMLMAAVIVYGLSITEVGLVLTGLVTLGISLLARSDSVDFPTFLTAGLMLYSVLLFLRLIGIDTPLWPLDICC